MVTMSNPVWEVHPTWTEIPVPPPTALALRGDLLDFTGRPAWGDLQPSTLRWRPGHWLLIRGGRIEAVQAEPPGPEWQRVDHSGRLILPGFIDTHVHSPQIDVLASYGTELLDWLDTHTFPAEARYADPAWSRRGAQRFIRGLLAHGTGGPGVSHRPRAGLLRPLRGCAGPGDAPDCRQDPDGPSRTRSGAR
jgi:cytosine/adenosine deaminase-related metal-dependent hydrolase